MNYILKKRKKERKKGKKGYKEILYLKKHYYPRPQDR